MTGKEVGSPLPELSLSNNSYTFITIRTIYNGPVQMIPHSLLAAPWKDLGRFTVLDFLLTLIAPGSTGVGSF
jgi:hypothetical protein